MDVYSFVDVVGQMTDPDVGPFQFAGQIGIGEFAVTMMTERSAALVAADGNIVISSIAGNAGHLRVQVQQTSLLHQYFLRWLKAKLANQNKGNVTTWLSAAISLRSVTTNTGHNLTGLCPIKMSDMPYATQAQNVTWDLLAADVQNF